MIHVWINFQFIEIAIVGLIACKANYFFYIYINEQVFK